MIYDSASRIDELVGGDKERLQFSYNENSKPVEIRQFKAGLIVLAACSVPDSSAGTQGRSASGRLQLQCQSQNNSKL